MRTGWIVGWRGAVGNAPTLTYWAFDRLATRPPISSFVHGVSRLQAAEGLERRVTRETSNFRQSTGFGCSNSIGTLWRRASVRKTFPGRAPARAVVEVKLEPGALSEIISSIESESSSLSSWPETSDSVSSSDTSSPSEPVSVCLSSAAE
ncbi:hypothetical protein KCU88_g444, partial [Aureobasidium melanogenum]